MSTPTALVVTSISQPGEILRALSRRAKEAGADFIIVGDTKSPAGFSLADCSFFDIDAQCDSGFELAAICPTQHYARKNLGYLLAIQRGARLIVETDDDNWPTPSFLENRQRHVSAPGSAGTGWVNVYRYFSEATIWPRGLPLEAIRNAPLPYETLEVQDRDCPIQQGLADENPDVDAIYRLVLPLPQRFRRDRRIALGPGARCPFNSQNTTWWPDAFPLLYLPATCSFRMTDIWRSLVAGRIAAENGWWILFHEPTVWQDRNEHNLMQDFADEVPGYLANDRIAEALGELSLQPGRRYLGDNLRKCYSTLVRLGFLGSEELALLEAWLGDLAELHALESNQSI